MNSQETGIDIFSAGRDKKLMNSLQEIIPLSAKLIQEKYPNLEQFQRCTDFAFIHLLEAPQSFFDRLEKVWFFPWVEATWELDQAYNTLLASMYKSTHDHLRRALEMIVMGAFFTLDETPIEKARKWMESNEGTPSFSKTIRKLASKPVFCVLDEKCFISDSIKTLYWKLCDIVHVKGQKNGFYFVQPSHMHIGDTWLLELNQERLFVSIDTYIEVVRHIATLLAASNPILLVGLDMDLKFGLNGPISGFFHHGQTELLKSLLLDNTEEVFEEIVQNDPGVQSLIQWYDSMPNITEEEMERQAKEMDEKYGNLRDKADNKSSAN